LSNRKETSIVVTYSRLVLSVFTLWKCSTPKQASGFFSTILFCLFLSFKPRSLLGLLMPRPHAVDDLTRLLVSQVHRAPLTKKFRSFVRRASLPSLPCRRYHPRRWVITVIGRLSCL